jgi:hypothetical protein
MCVCVWLHTRTDKDEPRSDKDERAMEQWLVMWCVAAGQQIGSSIRKRLQKTTGDVTKTRRPIKRERERPKRAVEASELSKQETVAAGAHPIRLRHPIDHRLVRPESELTRKRSRVL